MKKIIYAVIKYFIYPIRMFKRVYWDKVQRKLRFNFVNSEHLYSFNLKRDKEYLKPYNTLSRRIFITIPKRIETTYGNIPSIARIKFATK